MNSDDLLNDINVEMLLDDVENNSSPENDDESKVEYEPLKPKKGGHTLDEKINKSIERSLFKKNDENGLSVLQLKAIELTCKGLPVSKISKELNISSRVIYKWQKEQKYQQMLEKVQKDYLSTFRLAIMSQIPKAINSLVEILDNEKSSNKDKINASRSILEYSNIKQGGIKDVAQNENNYNTVATIQVNMFQQPPQPPKQDKKDVEVLENVDIDKIIDN